MQKVLLYSFLLLAGLIGSQFLPADPPAARTIIALGTMFCLAFLMIHVGYEFQIDKSRAAHYARDYLVAASAASLPWLFCSLYYILAMSPRAAWHATGLWKES